MSENPLPQTIEEAIQWMFERLDLENRKVLKDMPKSSLISLHHGYGTGIRNSLGLWGKNPALIQAGRQKEMLAPDDFSMYLIEQLWDYLQTIELPSDKKEA